jgi:predicted transcriptional regulator
MSEIDKVVDILFGRWKSQILYTCAKLGIFDYLTTNPKEIGQIAKDLNLDEKMTYRILRAMASLGFLNEEKDSRRFSITPLGELLRKDNPQTLQGVLLLEEGPEHYQIWKHLPKMIKSGQQNAFLSEYGNKIFEYIDKNAEYSKVFNDAMSSYSAMHTAMVLEALEGYDFSNFSHICDVGGGQGHLLGHLLSKYNHLKGTILELDPVVSNQNTSWPNKMGLQDRFKYIKGDMFEQVHSADLYIMKMILHDWNDDECKQILSNINKSSSNKSKVFIIEHIVPDSATPHFSKLFDIHMMCATSGMERTIEEYQSILNQSGWKYVQTHYPRSKTIGVIEGAKANS